MENRRKIKAMNYKELIKRAKELNPEAYDLKKRIAEGYEKLRKLKIENDKLLK